MHAHNLGTETTIVSATEKKTNQLNVILHCPKQQDDPVLKSFNPNLYVINTSVSQPGDVSCFSQKADQSRTGSWCKTPLHTLGPITTALLDSSGSEDILCTTAAQNIENHGYHYWYMFGIGKAALKIGVSYVSPKKKSRPWKSRFKTSYAPIRPHFLLG